MIASAQISIYPLRQDRLGPAVEIVRTALAAHDLEPQVGAMSTVVVGEDRDHLRCPGRGLRQGRRDRRGGDDDHRLKCLPDSRLMMARAVPASGDRARRAGQFGPDAYADWRASSLGEITETLEWRLIQRLAGEITGCAVLDVGCGDGALTRAFWHRGAARVAGCDTDPRMIARAGAQRAQVGADIVYGVARAEQLPFRDESFDLVTMITVLAFVPEPELALREIARVLKPGGRLVIGDLGKWSCGLPRGAFVPGSAWRYGKRRGSGRPTNCGRWHERRSSASSTSLARSTTRARPGWRG